MVILAATIISKSGKSLVEGQYGYLPPNRLEELFAAFLELVKSEKQHTANVLRMNNLRFVYQPFEKVYALLVTYRPLRPDNVPENDMDRLRLLSEVVREFYRPGDEDGPCNVWCELICAFDEVMSIEHTEAITIDHVKQHVKKYYGPSAAVSTLSKSHMDPPPTDPITVMIEENVNATLERDGLKCNFEVHGTLSLQLLNWKAGFSELHIASGDNPDIEYEIHPIIDNEWFSSEKLLTPEDPNIPLPALDHLLRWRLRSEDVSDLPLNINCWPCVYGNKTYLSIGYDASDMSDLQNVVISVPLPDLRDAPHVTQIDGEWRSRNPIVFSWPYLVGSEVLNGLIGGMTRYTGDLNKYDSKNSVIEWSIDLIDKTNRSGSLEFVVPTADTEAFFPIHARFSSTSSFSHVEVVDIIPLNVDEVALKFSQRMQMVAGCYKVV